MPNFFESPAIFAEFLLKAAAGQELALHEGLKKSLEIIKKKAKKKIGRYQPEVGPFQDWAELADATIEDRIKKGYTPDDPLLREGTLRDSIKTEIAISEGVVGSELDIAAYQEFGTTKIPPRPFIGPAAYESREKIKEILGFACFAGIVGGEKVHALLGYDFTTDE